MGHKTLRALLVCGALVVTLQPAAAVAQPSGDWHEQCFGDEMGIPDPDVVCRKVEGGEWQRIDTSPGLPGDVSSWFGTFVVFALFLSLVPAAAGAMMAKEAGLSTAAGFGIGLVGSWIGVIGLYLYGQSQRRGSPVISVGSPAPGAASEGTGPAVGVQAPRPAGSPDAADRLRTLKDLLDQGLITQGEYNERRAAAIEDL